MLKKIKEICLSLGIFSLLAVPVLVPASVYADSIANQLCSGSNLDTTGASTDCSDTAGTGGLNGILKKVITIFSVIVGFIAVIMIIIGGIRYITSGGNDGNVASAKNTIIYAIIGLIIVALAQVLVHYVLKNAGDAAGATTGL